MTDNNNGWWTSARQPRQWPGRGPVVNYARQQIAEPDVSEPEPDSGVGSLDLQQYAQVRDSHGIRSASEFVGLDGRAANDTSGFPSVADTSFNSAAELMAATNPYRRNQRPGEAPRERGIDASLVESDGGHRGRGTINPSI